MLDFNYIMEGNQLFVERQNKEIKKASSGKSGKVNIDNLGAFKNIPGVKHIKKKR